MTTIGNPGATVAGPKLVFDTPGFIGASQSLGKFISNQTYVLHTNFPLSYGNLGTAPTNTFTAALKINGTQEGTLTVSSSGTAVSFASSSNITLSAGTVLEIFAPATADPTAADLAITLQMFTS